VLEKAFAKERAARWFAENRDAIEAYNRQVEARGVWPDE
jgi:post-segregation antitoxin (ccd killing protein)